jgi:AcrR family transcriptional regulator
MSKKSASKREPESKARRVRKMEKILDCAEKEFATHGYSETPMHSIAAAANVNQALLSYYFGSKEGLYLAVFKRRGVELTSQRLRLLDDLVSGKRKRPTVEQLIRSFISPAIDMWYEGGDRRNFMRLQARLQNEPKSITAKLRANVYDEATRRFIGHFKAALPGLEPDAIVWRMVMMLGAYLYIVADAARIEQLSEGRCHIGEKDEVLRQLTAFLTGGFKHPLDRKMCI